VEKRNITLSLPKDLIRQAKVYAAEHDTTVNGLVRELLAETLARDSRAQLAAKHVLELAEQGPYFTADLRKISRQELHERR
jgi:plasmid stability protein